MVKRTWLFLMCSLAVAACAEGGVDEEQGDVDPPVAAEIGQKAAVVGPAAAAGPVGLSDDPDEGGQVAALVDDPDEGGQVAALVDDPDEGGQVAARNDGRGESASFSWCVDTPWGSTICCSARSCVSF